MARDPVRGLLGVYVATKRRNEAVGHVRDVEAARGALLRVFFIAEHAVTPAEMKRLNGVLRDLQRLGDRLDREHSQRDYYAAAEEEIDRIAGKSILTAA